MAKPNSVTEIPAAPSDAALAHFSARLASKPIAGMFGMRCAPVILRFVLVDVRSPKLFADGHVPGAVNIPHRTITAERMAEYAPDALFVVYCAGPHCNGANKGAVRLAQLGRPVKEMIGGITGWKDEGFELAR